jgi:hypothetical protein
VTIPADGIARSTWASAKSTALLRAPLLGLFLALFLFFFVLVELLVLLELFVFEVRRFFFFLFLGVDRGPALLELEIHSDVAELRVEELHELVGVVAGPLVEQIGQELEEVACVEAALDLFDLILGERLEDVFSQGLDVALLDRVLRRQADLTNGALVEVDLHRFPVSPSMRSALGLSTPVFVPNGVCLVRGMKSVGAARSIGGASLASLLTLAAAASAADMPAVGPVPEVSALPPSGNGSYIQYGVALAAEIVASAGPACSASEPSCILGSGGGVVIRAGWRPSETLYLGGAYEVSKLDPHQLYRLAILQQVRSELRWYVSTGRETSPFALLGLGVGAYGNDWTSVDTWGPTATAGVGLEVQLGGPVVVLSLAYRPMYFRAWEDSSTLSHDAGIAHFVGLEAAVEQQDAL